MTRIAVGMADFHHALTAVTPHVEPDPDITQLHRIRVSSDGQNLTLTATNRYTVGHAIVSIADPDGTLEDFDLTPTDAKELLALFKAVDDEQTLRIDIESTKVTFTDASGLFDGKALSLPRIATDENYPNVPSVISSSLTRAGSGAIGRLLTNGKYLGLFSAAVKAYSEPLAIEATETDTTALVISCGESFIGLLMPMRPEEDQDAHLDAWRSAWLRRLPPVKPRAA
jgi:hypothetical protein